jgi:hypothetical protein
MAIEALYPSRRQSRWSNPLFLRPLTHKLHHATLIASALTAIAVSLWCLSNSVQPHSAPVAQQQQSIAAG